jgi:hypothetical protein
MSSRKWTAEVRVMVDRHAKFGTEHLTGMTLNNLVAKGGIEPPTHGFSVRCSTN